MANAYLVVRIKGQADVPHWATTTMTLLKLDKKYRATILPAKDNTLGMLNKVKHYITWIELDADLAKALSEGTATLSKLKPLKPWFALSPPRHGFKRSTKKLYGQKGVLGLNKELGTIVRRMI